MAGKMPPAKSSFSASRRCIDPPRPVFAQLIFAPGSLNAKPSHSGNALFTQEFFPHVFQNVGGALDSDFSGENRILVLDAENTLEAHVHVGLDDGLPKAGAVAVADRAESLRGQIKFVGFESKVQHSVFIDVFGEENGVLHVRVEKGALFSQKVDDFDRIATLPEQVAQIAVRTDLVTNSLAKLHEGARIIDNEVRVHLEGEALDAMLAREFRGILPIWNDFFFPLPVLHLGIFGGPAVSNPVRLGVLRSAAGAAGKTDNHFYLEHFREQDGFAKRINIFLRVLRIRMNGIAMTTERSNANPAVVKLFQPGFRFSAVIDKFVERTMVVVWVPSRAYLHGLQAQGSDFVQHGVKREMFVNRIEHANRNLAQVTRRLGHRNAWKRCFGTCGMREHFTPGNRSCEQAARGGKKLSPSQGGVHELLLHASPRQTQGEMNTGVSDALYVTVTR